MTIKIPVSADTSGVSKGLDAAGKTVEKLERKTKWSPIDVRRAERDLKKIEQMVLDMQKRLGPNLLGVPPLTMPGAAAPPGSPPPRSPTPAGVGIGVHRARPRYHIAPSLYDAGQGFVGAVGGGFAQVGSAAMRGAIAGAGGGGGLFGGGMGLLRGAGIGALAFGAIKAGQAINEGYELAKDRASTLDTLKRQMGDLGIIFEELTRGSQLFSSGLALNSKEFAELAAETNKASGGADKDVMGLMDSTRTAASFARAFGISESDGVRMLGGIRHNDPRQNNRELALLIGETINRSGMVARADEVMRAFAGYAQSVAASGMRPNLPGFAGAYSDLVGAKNGITGETAANILSSAGAAVSRGGAAGEAGQFFSYQALSRVRALSPVEAMARMQGGLFATGASVFGGKDNPLAAYLGDRLATGNGSDKTNFEIIRDALKGSGLRKDLQLDAAQRFFGLSSLNNAAALMNISGESGGRVAKMFRDYNIDPNSLNERGMARFISVGTAKDRKGLLDVYEDLKRSSDLTAKERDRIDGAISGSDDDLRKALAEITAAKDQAQTDASRMQQGIKAVEEGQITLGSKLLVPLNVMMAALVSGSGKTPREINEEFTKLQIKDVRAAAEADLASINERRAAIEARFSGAIPAEATGNNARTIMQGEAEKQKLNNEEMRIIMERDAELQRLEQQRQIPPSDRLPAPEKTSAVQRFEGDFYLNMSNGDGTTTRVARAVPRFSNPSASGTPA